MLGLSTLGVAAAVKAIPEQQADRIPVHLNENAPKEDLIGKAMA